MSTTKHVNTEISNILSGLIAFIAFIVIGHAKLQSARVVPVWARRRLPGRQ